MQTAFAESLSFRPNCQLQDFGGTFRPDTHGCGANIFASLEYTPEVAEEYDRVAEPNGFVSIEEMPAPTNESTAPFFVEMEGTLEENLLELLSGSPRWLVVIYTKALDNKPRRPDILLALPKLVEKLVENGTYRPTSRDQKSHFAFFRPKARGGCDIARRILEALSTVH
jgi:hypothetical protein